MWKRIREFFLFNEECKKDFLSGNLYIKDNPGYCTAHWTAILFGTRDDESEFYIRPRKYNTRG